MNRKPNTNDPDFLIDDKPAPSLAVLDPLVRLGCAVAAQSIRDLHDDNHPLKCTDALVWLVSEGYEWLDELGFTLQPGQLIFLAARGSMRGARW
jgi:hypothetical protein